MAPRAAGFREALLRVPPAERDAWVDGRFGLDPLVADGPALPRGGVPYLPCEVAVLLDLVEQAAVGPEDVFVDVGSGTGRAAMLVHLLTGATAVGLEVQPELAQVARDLAARLGTPGCTTLVGDAAELVPRVAHGTVFFLYCPFGGARLEAVLAHLETRAHPIRIGTVSLPLPPRPGLERVAERPGDLVLYRNRR